MTMIDIREVSTKEPAAIGCVSSFFNELNEIFPQGFHPGPVSEWGLEKLEPPFGAFFVAFGLDGQPVGCVGLTLLGAGLVEVKRLWLDPSCRGKGLGRALMEAVRGKAIDLGATRMVLDTSRHLPGAVSFYRNAGWREVERYNDNPYAHHFFEFDLT